MYVSLLRDFWVSWFGGHIQVGRGWQVGVDVVIEYMIEDPPQPYGGFHAYAFSTGYGAIGYWEFLKDQGSSCNLHLSWREV